MLTDVKCFVSKPVPTLFPGNNGEHLQVDEESIISACHKSIQSRAAVKVKGGQSNSNQPSDENGPKV